MMLNKINGKMYNVIINMYDSIKSCISYNNCISEYFDCANGVRQGENLFPFLFSLFLNDVDTFLEFFYKSVFLRKVIESCIQN
jgi:hypothetical protein